MTPFKERMNLYRAYRELNPDKNYWDWKASVSEQENDFGYQEWKRNLPENLKYESPDYDLYGAYKAGMQPVLESDGLYHLGSRDPLTGRILKRKGHPTYLMTIDAEKAAGYDVYEGDDGEMYSKAPLPNKDISGWQEFKDYYNSNELGAKERQQLRSWYRRRKAYAERTGNVELLEQLKDDGHVMQRLFGNTQSYESKYYEGGRSYTNVNLDDVPVVIGLPSLLRAIGLYTPPRSTHPKGLIEISKNDLTGTTLLHEYAHVLNNNYDVQKKIADISNEHGGIQYYDIYEDPEYLTGLEEIHSRLQELRHAHNISPLQKVTKDDLKKMRKSGKPQHAILEYFADDDFILDLLNRVADAKDVSSPQNSNKNDVLATQFGGVVPAMLSGGNALSNLQDDNQLKYKSSNVKYNTDPSTFTKNLYNRIVPIPALMPEGLVIGGIKDYYGNSNDFVENTFSDNQLGTLDTESFNEFKEQIEGGGKQGYAEAMEPYILEDTKDIYLGMPQRFNTYEVSKYKPKNSNNTVYYRNKFLEEAGAPLLLDVVNDIKTNTTIPEDFWMAYGRAYEITKNKNALTNLPGFGHATVGNSIDPSKGEYVSYYDKWDVGLGTPNTKHPLDYIYNPVNIYGRVYLDDYYGVNSAPNEGDYYGGYLPEITVKSNSYADGGVIPAMRDGGNTEDYVGKQIDQLALQEAINQTGRDLYIADHTDPNTGVVSPFYNKDDDTYGTYQLPELTIKPEYKSAQLMLRALNRAEGKRGEEYWHKGALDATKFVGATVMVPLAATMLSVPAVASALDAIDVIADPFNPLAYLPYYNSSVGGRLVGAVAHKFGKAYAPELLRKSSQPLALTEDGRVIISGGRTGKGHDGITNFTTDRPVVSHSSGNWDSHDLYIVNPNKVDKNSFVSIEPSDTYTLTDNPITVDRGDVTVVTGNPVTIEYARKNGIPLVTNQKLQKAYQDAVNRYNFARAKEKASGSRLSFVKQEDFFEDYSRMLSQQYRKRTKPTLADYKLFSKETGLNPHVKAFDDDIAKLEYEYVTRPISAPPVTYPNGREILGSSHLFNLMSRDAYGNVFYDPATTSEGIFRKWRLNTGKTDKFEFWNKVWPEANM